MLTKQGILPLVRARGLGALPILLDERVGEAARFRLFRSAGLPLALETELDTPIPVRAMLDLFEEGRRALGERTFGLDVGERMTHLAYGDWIRFNLQAPTLHDGIARLCATSWAHQRGFNLSFVRTGRVWVWRATPLFGGVSQTQYFDHIIFPMIRFVQHYLGNGWRPVWVEVNYPRDPEALLIEDRIQAPMRFGGHGVAIGILSDDALRLSHVPLRDDWNKLSLKDLLSDTPPVGASEFVRSVAAVVGLRLLDGQSDLNGAAQLSGASIQALQRRLRREGYSYRDVLDAARRTRATSLLLDTRLSIAEIALSLGYEEHSSFTRAFTRWTGMSPQAFRKR